MYVAGIACEHGWDAGEIPFVFSGNGCGHQSQQNMSRKETNWGKDD